MKLHRAKEKPVTKRQLELLAAVSFGEVYAEIVRGGPAQGRYVHWYERPHEGKATPTDITQTLARMRQQKLIRLMPIEKGRARDEWERIIMVTPRARDVAEDACIDLL